jgi:hypothetical protein
VTGWLEKIASTHYTRKHGNKIVGARVGSPVWVKGRLIPGKPGTDLEGDKRDGVKLNLARGVIRRATWTRD